MTGDQRYRIWLSAVHPLGDRQRYALCAHFGSACAVYHNAKRDELLRALSGHSRSAQKHCDAILKAKAEESPEDLAERVYDLGCTVYAPDDDGYPPLLRDIGDDAPFLLYARGAYPPPGYKAVGIVGTRNNSRYGAEVAHRIARDLSAAGVNVVSGMADGIDAFAHAGAVEGGCATYAVLGCGADVIYPAANRMLYHEIRHHGAVLSEFYPGTKPLRHHFPARNRIISGMCRGVLVVECPEHSGAMITARLCVEQGRDLFTVPGNITSPQAAGSNELLMMGASPVLDAKDILGRFGWVPGFSMAAEPAQPVELSAMDRRVCDALRAGELFLEELAHRCGESVGALMAHLTLMEIRGIIKQLPGQRFALA